MAQLSPNALNFSGGPGALPESVLSQAQQAILEVPGIGLSVLGISHRSDWFGEVVSELENNIRQLLALPDSYHILFLQGGATQQFSMVPMSFMQPDGPPPDYLHTGYWSGKALPQAARQGAIKVLWSGEKHGFSHLPSADELRFSPDAPYLHYVSNETVEGLQFQRVIGLDGVPRVCDMSSDFLSRPCEATRFELIYAHAQKNIGPAGVTVVALSDQFLAKARAGQPDFLDYRIQSAAHSNFNTPPVFAIYVVLLVTRWLLNDIGGLAAMAAINARKAARLYQAIDDSQGFYRGHAATVDRSQMNVTFSLGNPAADKRFLAATQAAGLSGLNGHRAIGGLRASIYNGLSEAACDLLADFMRDFARKNRS